jgi:GTPase SAR1 family protein
MDKSEELDNSIMTVRYKLVLVGDTMVGKTAILDRFINDKFSGDYDVIKFFFIFDFYRLQ